MRTTRILQLSFILCFSIVMASCFGDGGSSANIEEIEVTEEVNEIIEKYKDEPKIEVEKPPITEEKKEIIKSQAAKSPFLNLGCCQELDQRGEPCCVAPVLQKFKTMLENEDPKLGEYKSTDPVLGAARKANPKAFEDVEDEFYDGLDEVE